MNASCTLKTTCILFWRWPSVGVSVRTSRRWTTRSWAAACATTTTRTSSTRRRANATSTASCATCKACWERRRRRSWAASTSHPQSPGGPRGPSTAPGRGGRSEDYGSEGSGRTCGPLKVKMCSISGIKKKLKVQQTPVNNTSAAAATGSFVLFILFVIFLIQNSCLPPRLQPTVVCFMVFICK